MKNIKVALGLALALIFSATAWAKDKPTIGVVEFQNQTSAGWWRGGVGWELAGMLTNELAATKAFRVVERDKLQSVMAEQNLAASGRVSTSTGAKIGKLTGAQYLVMGTVTAYEENTSDTGGGIGFRGTCGHARTSEFSVSLRNIGGTSAKHRGHSRVRTWRRTPCRRATLASRTTRCQTSASTTGETP